MLRVEISTSGWQKDRFERMLRRKLLITLYDALADYPDVEVNRVQFIRPKAK